MHGVKKGFSLGPCLATIIMALVVLDPWNSAQVHAQRQTEAGGDPVIVDADSSAAAVAAASLRLQAEYSDALARWNDAIDTVEASCSAGDRATVEEIVSELNMAVRSASSLRSPFCTPAASPTVALALTTVRRSIMLTISLVTSCSRTAHACVWAAFPAGPAIDQPSPTVCRVTSKEASSWRPIAPIC